MSLGTWLAITVLHLVRLVSFAQKVVARFNEANAACMNNPTNQVLVFDVNNFALRKDVWHLKTHRGVHA